MDFLEDLFRRHSDKPQRPRGGHHRYPAWSHPEARHGDPGYARMHQEQHDEHRDTRGAYHSHPGFPSLLSLLAQHKALAAATALLLVAVVIGGILALALLVPVAGRFLALLDAQNPSAVLADLPKLLTTLLLEMPKAVLEYLAPLLQLKSVLEGKA